MQSLLAPLSPIDENLAVVTKLDTHEAEELKEPSGGDGSEKREATLEEENGADLMSMSDLDHNYMSQQANEIEIEYERQESGGEEEISCGEQNDSNVKSDEHPVIWVPSSLTSFRSEKSDEQLDDSQNMSSYLNIEVEGTRSPSADDTDVLTTELGLKLRKACNCTKSQCLKLYCDCFANGEFCSNCNCNNCHNNLENEELRQKAIKGCLDRNPNAFRPKIGKSLLGGPDIIRRHNKGCNCKRSGCLKNYCECYEAKIACSAICKCIGCRNVEDAIERRIRGPYCSSHGGHNSAPSPPVPPLKQPCMFMTNDVIEAVCKCLIAAGAESSAEPTGGVIEEFARCLHDIITASQNEGDA